MKKILKKTFESKKKDKSLFLPFILVYFLRKAKPDKYS